VAVTVQDADEGDTTTSIEALIEAAEQVEIVVPEGEIKEVVADKGYHSNQVSGPRSRRRAELHLRT
jgi:transposase